MLKDGSLQINTLASDNCFSCRKVFQNDVKVLFKIVLKNPVISEKAQNFAYFDHMVHEKPNYMPCSCVIFILYVGHLHCQYESQELMLNVECLQTVSK